ncbi:MAG: putative Ig domain-containing protein [Verrucomicrobiae bacterium]|nr:putative Ig domain-containing protein [Verrucomicrobiae bacterium]
MKPSQDQPAHLLPVGYRSPQSRFRSGREPNPCHLQARAVALFLWILTALAGAFPAQAQGELTNGAQHQGTIAQASESDTWLLTLQPGDTLILRAGAEGLTPRIQVFNPSGTLIGTADAGNSFARDNELAVRATAAGIHQVVVNAKYATQTGTYVLNVARIPGTFTVSSGDEGGELPNGVKRLAELDRGDLDLWSFTANAGDGLMLRVGATNFTPWLRLYGPDGALVGEAVAGNSFARDNVLTLAATSSGTHTLVISAKYADQLGPYAVNLARIPGAFDAAPGDEDGELPNGVKRLAELDRGDLDVWSFAANAGDGLMLRVGATNFTPWLRLYGPNGALVDEVADGNSFTRDNVLTLTAASSGTHTLVVSAKYADQLGSYEVNLARIPGAFDVADGDEGGELPNGVAQAAELDRGDLDLWSFAAKAGDGLMLRVGSTGFTPWLRLYGPDGVLAGEVVAGNSFTRDNVLTLTATNAGIHTLVVSAKYADQLGPYVVSLARTSGDVGVAPGDEGGGLRNAVTNLATLSLGDLDVWSFVGTPGDSNVFRVAATNFTPWIRLYGPDGTLVKETTTGNSFARDGLLTYAVPDGGNYTIVVSATYSGQEGGYAFRQSRVPPDLILPEVAEVNEGDVLSVPMTAEDPDQPDKPLTFELLSGPPGMVLIAGGPTNVTLSWPTAEADGPGTHEMTAVVTDLVNGSIFRRTNSFTVIVREVNTPPQLAVPEPQTLDELSPLNVAVIGTDDDLPANPLTFSLIDPPAGMAIDPVTGAITWVPTEAQGPETYTIAVAVTDDSPEAVNDRRLSVTNTWTVTVREVNTAPQLVLPADPTVDELTLLTVNVSATDADLPANTLTFGLVSAPTGVSIDPATGTITWTPEESQGPGISEIVIRVQDNGTPVLSATNTLRVTVREVNVAPVLAAVPVQQTGDDTIFRLTVQATDADLPANRITYSLGDGAPAGATINAETGELAVPIGVKLAEETQTLTVRATDDGSPALTAEQTITLNIVPPILRLAPVGDQQLDEQTLFSLTAAVTNSPRAQPPFAFALDGEIPSGASINATTGVLFWRPTEAQGPSTNRFTIRVSDSASPPNVTNQTFLAVVREVNQAPVLSVIPNQTTVAGGLLTFTVTATDEDLPANTLTFSLGADAPPGMTLQSSSGVLTWQVPATAGGATNEVTVRVTDNGEPSLEATRTFRVVVTQPSAQSLAIEFVEGGQLRLRLTGSVGQTYLIEHSTDMRNWEFLTNFVSSAVVTELSEAVPIPFELRFYRAIAP